MPKIKPIKLQNNSLRRVFINLKWTKYTLLHNDMLHNSDLKMRDFTGIINTNAKSGYTSVHGDKMKQIGKKNKSNLV